MKSLIKFAFVALALAALTAAARSQIILSHPVNNFADSSEQIGTSSHIASTSLVSKPGFMLDSLSQQSLRVETVVSMSRAISKLVKYRIPGSTQLLRAGKTIDVSALIDTNLDAAAWHSVNIKASYDARPIGGILNIRVGLSPVFGGIGSAVRTLDYREFAEAVDDFDDDFIAQTISRLTFELGAEYTKDH